MKKEMRWYLLIAILCMAVLPSVVIGVGDGCGNGEKSLEAQLLDAVQNGDTEKCAILLKAGANPNKMPADSGNSGCDILLLPLAAQKGNYNICKLLLKYGVSVDDTGPSSNYYTPLQIAAEDGNRRLCKLFIANKANVNKQIAFDGFEAFPYGCTALHLAVVKGRYRVSKLLIEAGADVNLRATWWDVPALGFASDWGHLEICKLLVEHGAGLDDLVLSPHTAVIENYLKEARQKKEKKKECSFAAKGYLGESIALSEDSDNAINNSKGNTHYSDKSFFKVNFDVFPAVPFI